MKDRKRGIERTRERVSETSMHCDTSTLEKQMQRTNQRQEKSEKFDRGNNRSSASRTLSFCWKNAARGERERLRERERERAWESALGIVRAREK